VEKAVSAAKDIAATTLNIYTYDPSPTTDVDIDLLYPQQQVVHHWHTTPDPAEPQLGIEESDGALTRLSDFGGAKSRKRRQATFKDQIRSVHIHLPSVSTSTYPS
jgi:hypothetical protein